MCSYLEIPINSASSQYTYTRLREYSSSSSDDNSDDGNNSNGRERLMSKEKSIRGNHSSSC